MPLMFNRPYGMYAEEVEDAYKIILAALRKVRAGAPKKSS